MQIRWITSRFAHGKTLLWRRIVGIVATPYALLGVATQVQTHFFNGKWRVVDFLPSWSVATWIAVGLGVLWLLALEGSYQDAETVKRRAEDDRKKLEREHHAQMEQSGRSLSQEQGAIAGLREELHALRQRVLDNGPRLTVGYERTGLHTGFFIRIDQDVAEVSVGDVESSMYVLKARAIPIAAPGATPLEFEYIRKDTGERFEGFKNALDDYCRGADNERLEREVPLNFEYGDLRGNRFSVRWLVTWSDIESDWENFNPIIRQIQSSYCWIDPHAANAVGL